MKPGQACTSDAMNIIKNSSYNDFLRDMTSGNLTGVFHPLQPEKP